jgi:hypothetical protein
MSTDLALIDWIALAFSAVLLATAAAAATIAYATSLHRSKRPRSSVKPLSFVRSTLRRSTPQHVLGSTNSVGPDFSPSSTAVRADKVVLNPVFDVDAQLAARAAKLRRRPVPEQNGYEHQKRVVGVVPKGAPAHAKEATRLSERVAGGVATVHYDRTEGFKARTPGFFDDPMGRHELRYWDGHSWTEYVKEHGERFTDPL